MYDFTIIGGGVVGLATAYQLARLKPQSKILILEKESEVGAHQSSHNSGVLHSGIYYKPGSLKAKNCLAGYKQMLDFLAEHSIPHELCGKLIVATEKEELPALKMLYDRGKQNGLSKNQWLEGLSEIHAFEPYAAGLAAIQVPYAGIVDYKQVCAVLKRLIQQMGHEFRLGFEVKHIQRGGRWMVTSKNDDAVETKYLVDAAGLYSDRIARKMGNDDGIKIVPFRGEYYLLKKESEHKIKSLIYPVPNLKFPFLGVHFTRMVGGGVEAGPNAVLALAREGYSWGRFNAADACDALFYPGFWRLAAKHASYGISEIWRSLSKQAFVRSLQRLLPEIQGHELIPGGAGVRAQALRSDGSLVDDFALLPIPGGLIVANAPSPAATSSLAIGQTIADTLISSIK